MQTGGIQAVAFDVDGTLVEENFWLRLHELFGVSLDDDTQWMNKYHAGEWNYRTWMDTVSEAYARNPQKREAIERVVHRYEFYSGTRGIIQKLKTKYPVALISSNIATYIEAVAKELDVDEWHAYSDFAYNGEYFSHITYTSDANEKEAKVASLTSFAKRVGVKPESIAFVGDSINDLDVFEYTGKGILIREGTESLKRAAWKRVDAIEEVERILL